MTTRTPSRPTSRCAGTGTKVTSERWRCPSQAEQRSGTPSRTAGAVRPRWPQVLFCQVHLFLKRNVACSSVLPIGVLPNTGNATALSCGRNSAFPDSDYVSHSPADDSWLLTVHMVSARTKGSACVNSQGKKSQKLSDGATALYYRGDEYSDVAVVLANLQAPARSFSLLPLSAPAAWFGYDRRAPLAASHRVATSHSAALSPQQWFAASCADR